MHAIDGKRLSTPIPIDFSPIFVSQILQIHRSLAQESSFRSVFREIFLATQKQMVDNMIRTDSRCQNVSELEIDATT